MSECGQSSTLTKNVGRGFFLRSTPPRYPDNPSRGCLIISADKQLDGQTDMTQPRIGLQNCKHNTSVNNTIFIFYIQWYVCQGDMFRPSRSSSGPPRRQIKELFSFPAFGILNAGKLNNSWICLLGGPEDDLLGRNMSS